MISQTAVEAIESSDTDELIRVIDGLCESKDWDGLVALKIRCREAVGRGKQLWGVEEHIRYRLALEAPAEWAGAALNEGVSRFSLGPLPEVAASTKSWAEMGPHLDDGPWKGVFAAERVVRGDRDVDFPGDLPRMLLPWEPSYMVATYKSDKVEAPSPPPPTTEVVQLSDHFEVVADPESEGALGDLVQHWATESNGRYQIATVEGDASSAVRALGLTTASLAELDMAGALRWMAWAGASGGAHGRRPGAAAGRFGAWWALATLTDLDWPVAGEELHDATRGMRFFWFDDGSPLSGWQLRIVIEDPGSNLAWAVSASDQAD